MNRITLAALAVAVASSWCWTSLGRAAAPDVQVSQAVAVKSAFDNMRIYPNPWRADKHADVPVTFDRLPASAAIKLFTVSGRFVKSLEADGTGAATWDLTNDGGDHVASGLYLYTVSADGQETKGKLAVIR
ncbi:MAG TPA: T9SS type A sorting domain-containing protein [Elusimicrobiota bacterium]|nr:T9SS type A sorting domain-containing protein [Elusimicrobiota bacterium]